MYRFDRLPPFISSTRLSSPAPPAPPSSSSWAPVLRFPACFLRSRLMVSSLSCSARCADWFLRRRVISLRFSAISSSVCILFLDCANSHYGEESKGLLNENHWRNQKQDNRGKTYRQEAQRAQGRHH